MGGGEGYGDLMMVKGPGTPDRGRGTGTGSRVPLPRGPWGAGTPSKDGEGSVRYLPRWHEENGRLAHSNPLSPINNPGVRGEGVHCLLYFVHQSFWLHNNANLW